MVPVFGFLGSMFGSTFGEVWGLFWGPKPVQNSFRKFKKSGPCFKEFFLGFWSSRGAFRGPSWTLGGRLGSLEGHEVATVCLF